MASCLRPLPAQHDLAVLDHNEPRTSATGLAPHHARIDQPGQPDRAASGERRPQREPLEGHLNELLGPPREATTRFVGIVFINVAVSPPFPPQARAKPQQLGTRERLMSAYHIRLLFVSTRRQSASLVQLVPALLGHNYSEGNALMLMLVATDREVVVIDVERGTAAPAHGIGDRPTCLTADPLVHGRAWCGTHRSGVFRTDDGGRSWQSVGLAGAADYGHYREPVGAGRGLGRHRAERSVALRGRWEHVGADQQVGDAVVVVRMVLSAETGYSSRSLDCVPPARTGTTLGRD